MDETEKMKRFENRKARLLHLINTKTGGNKSEFARKIGKEPSYVARLFYPVQKTGSRRIGDDLMLTVESVFNLPRGWLDADDDTILDWPFPITREQYKDLPQSYKDEINRYIRYIYHQSHSEK